MPSHPIIPASIFDLADLLERDWATQLRDLRKSGVPLNADDAGAAAETATGTAAETAADQPVVETSTETEAATTGKEDLGDSGKAALDAERKARRDAEKRAKAAEGEAKKLQDAQLTETERLKQEAEAGKTALAKATDKTRSTNLVASLMDDEGLGLSPKQAKAAARLLDGVEFDEDDEPTNLKEAIKGAKAKYGASVFAPAQGRTSFDAGTRKTATKDDFDAQIRRSVGIN